VNISFKEFSNKDNKPLVDFLASEIWPFNVTSKLTSTKVMEWIKNDKFIKPENKAYWIILDNEKRIGLICLYDVSDTLMMYPEFEMWISSSSRTSEILKKIIQSFISDFFNKHKEAIGILTQMRQDDSIIRQVYHQCAFTKEGHRRKSWPSDIGMYYDSVEYAILREDWEQRKVTPVDWNDADFDKEVKTIGQDVKHSAYLNAISYSEFLLEESEEMAHLLSSDNWEYYIFSNPTKEEVMKWIKDGKFSSKERQTFWVILDGKEKVGMIRVFGLLDPLPYGPQMDIRIKSQYRGKGIGKMMLSWLTDHIFTTIPEKIRIEGYTRQYNKTMRKVFGKCGYVKEGHYRRRKNKIQKDLCYDIIGYGITRDDWEKKKITSVDWYDKQF
jgi:RimJ/RimL family protein N-acetyltransferase